MSSKDLAVSVRGLSKAYTISHNATKHTTAGEAIVHRLKNPIQRIDKETFWALKDVSFDVMKGEVVGIIGRNGAGKSTLLKVLSQITEPTEGEIRLYGRVGSLLEVGTGFHPELTGRENIYLNGAILGMKKSEITRQFDAIVDFAEVEKFLDTPVKRYSSGMYVRLAFAVAAHLNPEILIVDEVLAVGDAQFQEKCLGKMHDVSQQEGKTVLFVSHNMNAVEQLCTSVLRLSDGRFVERSSDLRRVIKGYLSTNEGTSSAHWKNDGESLNSPFFKPLEFFVADDSGVPLTKSSSNDTDFHIYIHAEIDSMDSALGVGYALYSEDNILIYWSIQTDSPHENWPRIHQGHNIFHTSIPSHLLNEGNYRIELIAALHFRFWILEPGINSPIIHLSVQGGLSESPHWLARRPGLLAPILNWSTLEKDTLQ